MHEETTYWTAEKVTVDDDEGRFILDISTDEGERLTVNIHGIDLDAFYDQVKGRIGPYLQEMHAAREDVERTRGTWVYQSGAARAEFRCSPEDVDESGGLAWKATDDPDYSEEERQELEKGGYDTSDPKHENFHSIHADIWDARAGK